jgi:hypothetical protein
MKTMISNSSSGLMVCAMIEELAFRGLDNKTNFVLGFLMNL